MLDKDFCSYSKNLEFGYNTKNQVDFTKELPKYTPNLLSLKPFYIKVLFLEQKDWIVIGLIALSILTLLILMSIFVLILFFENVFANKGEAFKNPFAYLVMTGFFLWIIYLTLINIDAFVAFVALLIVIFLISHFLARCLKTKELFPNHPLSSVYLYTFTLTAFLQTILVFGYGYIIPNFLRPSYYTQFSPLCSLNNLKDNKEKFDKILSLLNLNLKNLDYEKLNRYLTETDGGGYKSSILMRREVEYNEHSWVIEDTNNFFASNSEIEGVKVILKTQQAHIDKNNIHSIQIEVYWDSHRSSLYWNPWYPFDPKLKDRATIMCRN